MPYHYLSEVDKLLLEDPRHKQIKETIKRKTEVERNMKSNSKTVWSIYPRNRNNNKKVQSPIHIKPQMISDAKIHLLDEKIS